MACSEIIQLYESALVFTEKYLVAGVKTILSSNRGNSGFSQKEFHLIIELLSVDYICQQK